MQTFDRDHFDRLFLAAIVVLAVALRVVAAVVIPDQSHLLVDAVAYRQSAISLVDSLHPQNPYQMPLYPLMIAITGPGLGQLAADILLSVLLVAVVHALTLAVFGDRLAALLAALMTACYPPFIFISIVGLSESLFITLVLLSFLFWYRRSFTPAVIFAVLAVLTRPVFDVFAPLLVLLFALVVHGMSLKQASGRLFAYVAIYCALMTPWWLANYQEYGQFVRLTAGGGTQLYAGNNPLNKTGGALVGEDYDMKDFLGIPNLADRDRAAGAAAIAYIRRNPAHFIELAWLKFVRVWRPWPVNPGYSGIGILLVTAGSYLPVLVLALVGIAMKRRNWRRLSPIYAFAGAYTLVHMVMAGTIRYRLPLEPFLIIFAAIALSEFWREFRLRRFGAVTH